MTSLVAEHAQETGASVSVLCRTVGLSRATFYRCSKPIPMPQAEETNVRDAIKQIALEFSSYGYRRIAAQLARQGVVVNHKRVLRLMREDNWLCLRKRRFIKTTDSEHGLQKKGKKASPLVGGG